MSLSSAKRTCICAVCIALCYVLPIAFHAVGAAGVIFAPMHIPVLLCGLVCGPFCGALCGVVGPLLSSLLTGMPPATQLISMIPELFTYGLSCGLLLRVMQTRNTCLDLYCALVPAMLLGRVVGGAAKALFYLASAKPYSLALWASGYLISTLPGILLHLLTVPALVLLLMRAQLLPPRYPAAARQGAEA